MKTIYTEEQYVTERVNDKTTTVLLKIRLGELPGGERDLATRRAGRPRASRHGRLAGTTSRPRP